MAHILAVSYDESLLRSREMLLKAEGYDVVSARRWSEALERCEAANFDLVIVGHTIPEEDKRQLMAGIRRVSTARIICLQRHPADGFVTGADFHVQADPDRLLSLIADVLAGDAPERGT